MTLTRRELVSLLLIVLLSRAVITAVGTAAVALLPSTEGEEFTHLLDGGPALDMWYRWDAGFYTSIATFGYDWFNERRPADDLAFLPLYPALIHLVSGLTPTGCALSPYLSTCATIGGLIVSNVALTIAAVFLFDLGKRRFGSAAAWWAIGLLALTPNGIFLSGVYTEATFLLWVTLTLWLLERKQFYAALIPAALACLTRSVGVALFPALLWAAWQSAPTLRGRLPKLIAAGIPPALFAGWLLTAGLIAGDPLAYFNTYQGTWDRASASPIEAFTIYFSGESVSWFGWELSWIDLAAALGYLALGVIVLRVDRAWGLFALAAIAIPIATGSLLSMPRFGAVIAPFYLIGGAWLAGALAGQRALMVRRLALALPLIGLSALFITRFVTWRWIA